MKQDIIQNIIHNAGNIENLMLFRFNWENDSEYMDRIYEKAHELFMGSVEELGLNITNDEDVAPYDDIRDEALQEIMDMLYVFTQE